MPRLSRFQILNNSKKNIIKELKKYNRNVYNMRHIEGLLSNLKTLNLISKITTTFNLLDFLITNNIFEKVSFVFGSNASTPTKSISRYAFCEKKVSFFEIAISINVNSYLTHYSAMYIHELTDNVPKIIYTNFEQTPKYRDDDSEFLYQDNIDKAFKRPMRTTNQIAKIKDSIYSTYFLNGKNVNKIGVVELNYNNSKIKVTNLERTLIDITVRPAYSGGVNEVLNAYILAKDRISTNKLIAILKKMDYIYPYHQAIGFYMERAGYNEKSLILLEKLPIKYNFYLTYQMKTKLYSDRWHLFFPEELN
jgi:predicted transcriptional regulator of viral defense system